MKFSEFNLSSKLLQGIDDAGFIDCLPVQERTIDLVLQGKDVMVQSQTGSGKTAAFLVPIFELFSRESYKNSRRALIIAPTRELAVQIEDEAKILGAHLNIRTGCFYGGVGYDRQEHLLEKGVDIIIGTPGRLIDFNQSKKLHFNDIGVLVIDEADRLFDMGFLPDLRRILKKMPDITSRQTMLFSATLSTKVQELAFEHMHDPVAVDVAPENITVETVTQRVYHVSLDEKMKLLIGLLKKENPESALIFTNMKTKAAEVARRLTHNGFGCEYIIGDLPQKKRLDIINAMKTGKIRILVATDVAARGLHINDLDLVVNYDLPANPESYVHRIGRTARAGKAGKAITLVCERYVYGLEAIESLINMKIPVAWAAEEDFAGDTTAGRRMPDEKRAQQRGRSHERTEKQRPVKKERQHAKIAAPEKKRGTEKLLAENKEMQPDKPKHEEKAESKAEQKHPSERRQRGRQHTRDRRYDADRKKTSRHEGRQQPAKPDGERGTTRKQSIDDRLAYYRKKYGENFSAAGAAATEPKKRKSRKIIDAIKGIFSRKKTKSKK